MKKLLYCIFLIIIIDISFQRCANPGRPTGGPKDTIPPTLINSYPLNGTTNFQEQEFVLEFTEYISADQLRQQLIITPKTDVTYKSIAKRNRLLIKLEEPLQDSTTYNFNFADGVTDITEKNPAVNLSLAFSTGPFIDSLSVEGTVEELLTKKPGEGFLVGLYPLTDTLSYFTQNPMYFTTADTDGNYQINYIKSGKYKIISFDDDNGNYLLDPESEQHGFLEQTIYLDSSLILDPIRCILQNVKPIALINARPTGPYVEIKFNKQPDYYSIQPEFLNHTIIGDKKDIIRLYKPEQLAYRDSTQSIVNVSDSLGNLSTDTIKYVFLESNRKLPDFNVSAPSTSVVFKDSFRISLNFNKPIDQFDSTKFSLQVDSTFNQELKPKSYLNYNKTQLSLDFIIDSDSLLDVYNRSLPKDTTQSDTLTKSDIPKLTGQQATIPFKMIMEKNAIISIESDSSKSKEFSFKQPKQPSTAVLKITVTTDYPRFTVQLLNDNGTVKYSISDQKLIEFENITADTYTIRVLIDEDQDGRYSYGNLLNDTEPEPIYLHPEPTSVRENWVVELGISF